MTLAPLFFKLKWIDRFADNTAFLISEADLREFAGDVADSAGVPAAQLAVVAAVLPLTAAVTANYTLALADAGQLVPVASSSAVVVTFPDHATVPLPVGSTGYVRRTNTGAVSLVAASGVQLLPPSVATSLADYGEVSWHKVDVNTFWLKGDLV